MKSILLPTALRSMVLIICIAGSGCATNGMKDQRMAELAAQHDQAATDYRKQGNAQLATISQNRADEIRKADKNREYGFIEFLVGTVFGYLLDTPSQTQKRQP
jgi:hypothetical protein